MDTFTPSSDVSALLSYFFLLASDWFIPSTQLTLHKDCLLARKLHARPRDNPEGFFAGLRLVHSTYTANTPSGLTARSQVTY